MLYNLNIQFYNLKIKDLSMECNCRCINCKGSNLNSNDFKADDGYVDSHHTCMTCGTHFNHLDGEQFEFCSICDYDKKTDRRS